MAVKKKIVHVGFRHSIEDVRIYKKECTSLAKSELLDVTYIVSDINSEMIHDRKNNVERIVLKSYPKRILRQFVYNRQIKEYLSENDVDLMHIHETPLLLIALWAKRRGLKVIFDSHEDYYQQYIKGHGRIIAKLYKAYEKYVCKRIDAVIFPCKMLSEQPFWYPVKRLVYIDNYPIVKSEDYEKNKAENERNEFTACYTGTITIGRGVLHAIKAWNKAGIKGILAGKYGSEDERKQIEAMPEFSSVEYVGFLPFDEVVSVYERSSVGMATLLDRGQYHKTCNLPTKVGEYMIAGIPTIIFRTRYVEELLQKYRFGIAVDPENVDEIVDALNYMKDHPRERQKMADEGRRAIREFYNWGTQERKLFDLYGELLDENITCNEEVKI